MTSSGCGSVKFMNTIAKLDVRTFTVSERLERLQALWGSLIESSDGLTVSDAQRAVLDQRLAAYEKNPTEGASWNDVRARIQRT